MITADDLRQLQIDLDGAVAAPAHAGGDAQSPRWQDPGGDTLPRGDALGLDKDDTIIKTPFGAKDGVSHGGCCAAREPTDAELGAGSTKNAPDLPCRAW